MKPKMRLLILMISEMTFEESILLTHLGQQLSENSEIYCMVNAISSAYVFSDPKRICSLLTENQEDNYRDFHVFMEEVQPDAILILDLYQYFLVPEEINFRPEWLTDLSIPVLALDTYNLMEYNQGQLQLRTVQLPFFSEQLLPVTPPLTIYPRLLKPFPPIRQHALGDTGALRWNSLLEHYRFVKSATQEIIHKTMALSHQEKIVSLVFDPQLLARALDLKMVGYYPVLIETLLFYLDALPEHIQVLIVGFKAPSSLRPLERIKVRYFTHLTEDLYQLVVCGSDLILLNNNWSFMHVDALVAGTPTLVMGNSVQQEGKALTSTFQPHPFLYKMIELLMQFNQQSVGLPIYPFISYPLKAVELPPAGMQLTSPPFHLADMFNDLETLPLIQKLICDHSYLKQYQKLGNKYLDEASGLPRLETLLKEQVLNPTGL